MKRRIDPFRMGRPCGATAPAAISIALVVAALTATARGDDNTMGVVSVDEAEVRSGAGDAYYQVGKLERGAKVQIRGFVFEWYKVVPPKGVFSDVDKQYVDVDGQTGTINRDRTTVKAASVDGPGAASYRRQIDLRKGDKVRIVDAEGEYYKIVPPKNAYVFVRVSNVRRVDNDEIDSINASPVVNTVVNVTVDESAMDEPQTAVSDPVTESAPDVAEAADSESPRIVETTVEVIPAPVVEDAPPAPPVAVSAVLADLEDRRVRAETMPLEDQPIAELIAGYHALLDSGELTTADRRTAQQRLMKLRRNAALATTLREIALVQQSLRRAPAVPPQPEPVIKPVEYDAVGQLMASGVYDGINLPRLYRIVSPTLRTIAYVRPDGEFETVPNLGRVVGVVGETQYDPALKLRVLDVARMDVLRPDAANVN